LIERKVAIKDKPGNIVAILSIAHDITAIKKYQGELELTQEQLKEYNHNLEATVEKRTKEIIQKNIDLKDAYDNLSKTQKLLLESEKMAALGKIISGIAHDINSPLGSIKSSVHNSESLLKQYLNEFPEFYLKLNSEERNKFNSLFHNISISLDALSTSEKRQIKRKVNRELDELDIENSYHISKAIVELNLQEKYNDFMELIKSDNSDTIFEYAENIAHQLKSTEIIKLAVQRASNVVVAMKNYVYYSTNNQKNKYKIDENIDTVLILFNSLMKEGVLVEKKYDKIPEIYCNANELNQVWTNIIDNALQAMNYKGVLTLNIEYIEDDIIVRISDSGCGIPEDVLPHIFEPFYTTKPIGRGTGIGLDVSRQYIANCKGIIKVESEINKGTRFEIRIPVSMNQYEVVAEIESENIEEEEKL
jgi:C4-dicarboxylate-specific signal transduction histidine kinase